MAPGPEVVCVTIDCREPAIEAGFWSATLGWDDVHIGRHGAAIRPPDGHGPYLEFVQVPEDKVVKNRVHLGLHAGSLPDLDAFLDRLLGLGATVAWEEEFPPEIASVYRNIVLRDPEGNEFCLGGGSMEDAESAVRP